MTRTLPIPVHYKWVFGLILFSIIMFFMGLEFGKMIGKRDQTIQALEDAAIQKDRDEEIISDAYNIFNSTDSTSYLLLDD